MKPYFLMMGGTTLGQTSGSTRWLALFQKSCIGVK
jgi:hypothetical protein